MPIEPTPDLDGLFDWLDNLGKDPLNSSPIGGGIDLSNIPQPGGMDMGDFFNGGGGSTPASIGGASGIGSLFKKASKAAQSPLGKMLAMFGFGALGGDGNPFQERQSYGLDMKGLFNDIYGKLGDAAEVTTQRIKNPVKIRSSAGGPPNSPVEAPSDDSADAVEAARMLLRVAQSQARRPEVGTDKQITQRSKLR